MTRSSRTHESEDHIEVREGAPITLRFRARSFAAKIFQISKSKALVELPAQFNLRKDDMVAIMLEDTSSVAMRVLEHPGKRVWLEFVSPPHQAMFNHVVAKILGVSLNDAQSAGEAPISDNRAHDRQDMSLGDNDTPFSGSLRRSRSRKDRSVLFDKKAG